MKRGLDLIVTIFLFTTNLGAQVNVPDLDSDLFFDYSNFSSEEMEALIIAYSEQPLIWQQCSESDLQALPLRADLKMTLIELHQKHPKAMDWSTLRRLGNFSANEIEILKLFLAFAQPTKRNGELTYYSTLTRYNNSLDIGKILFRWRQPLTPQLQWGAVIERDPQEPNLVDHWNITASLLVPAYDARMIWGAYRLHWGCGLLHSQNLMSSYTTDAISNISSGTTRLSPYQGSDENRYLFGAAMQKNLKNASFFLFCSRHRLDAVVDSQLVTHFLYDGRHITPYQLAAKDAVTESVFGLAGLLPRNQTSWGWLTEMITYSNPLTALNQDRKIINFSLMHHHRWDQLQWRGEMVVQSSRCWGFLESLIWTGKGVSLALSVRHYQPNFYAPLGAPLSQLGSTPQNEQGIYSGWKIRLKRNFWWSSYLDYYRSIETSQQTSSPTSGCDFVNSLNLRFKTRAWLQVTNRLYNQYGAQMERDVQRKSAWHFRLHKDFDSHQGLNLTLILSNAFQNPNYTNSALSCYYQWRSTRLTWIVGLTDYFVQTGNLLYLSEPGVPMQYNLVTLSKRGYRFYGVILFRPQPGINLAGAVQYGLQRPDAGDAQKVALSGNVQLSVGL